MCKVPDLGQCRSLLVELQWEEDKRNEVIVEDCEVNVVIRNFDNLYKEL